MNTRRMVLAASGRRDPGFVIDRTGDYMPRGYVFEDIFDRRLDEALVDEAPGPLRAIYRLMPPWVALALELQRRRDEHDVIVSWSERVSVPLMMLQALTGRGTPHVAMMYWFSRPSVRTPMRLFWNSLHALITWSSVQRRYAIDELGVDPDRIHLVKHYVDQVFWRPRDGGADMICAAGAEMRDYWTLLEALKDTDLRCHIATDHVRVDRRGIARRVSAGAFAHLAGDGVSVGRLPLPELRDVYARSRFVVVPLEATDTDNGVTVILEAMAMGKPVICSRTQGQVDVIEDGKTGIFVPVGDARALREAMVALWKDPARAEAMGRAARAHVEKHHTMEKFAGDVRRAIDASFYPDESASPASPASSSPASRGGRAAGSV